MKGRKQTDDIWEEGAEGNIWTEVKLEKAA
jgi:hypothetical protein